MVLRNLADSAFAASLRVRPTTFSPRIMSGGRGKPDLSGYNYGAISSLVLTADRSALPRRDKEPDGAPESLVGRIDPKEMGSRVQRQAPKDLDRKKKKRSDRADAAGDRPAKRRPAESAGFGYTDIIEATQDVEGLTYRPRTTETRDVYELILSAVHQALGDQAQDIIRSAADTVLETLKSEALKDFDKKKETEDVIGPLSNETFSQLINLSKKITDYGAEDKAEVDPDIERKDAEIDDEVGVAVVFEDEEEEEEEEEEGYEIREESDEEAHDEGREGSERATDEDEADAIVFGVGSSRTAKSSKSSTDRISPHEIDGFWLQRQIAEVYPDPVTATDKTTEALSILGSEFNLRDCENALMELFDYSWHQVVSILTKNRDVIVWCTKLARSDRDERVNVEVAMREKGVGWILKDLAGDRRAKPVIRADAGKADAMDVDETKTENVPSTGTVVPGSTPAPRKVLDLESMAFSQGGHLMSNKKCKLPDGSFKRSKKGYEEIHVPAPKPKPVGQGELVPVTDLPLWAREAFGSTKTLNRIQSKLFPIAFGTDEPILLCAPTGAGKVSFCWLKLSGYLC